MAPLGVRWKPVIGLMVLAGLVMLLTGDPMMLADPYPSNSVEVSSAPAPPLPNVAVVPPMGHGTTSAPVSCAASCQHGGMCIMQKCRCPRGYAGTACQTRLSPPAAECGPPRLADGPDSTGPSRCRPSFLIIGAGKSGTSSLYYYLAAHPAVHPAVQKQLQFFDHGYPEGQVSGQELRSAMETYFSRGFPSEMVRN